MKNWLKYLSVIVVYTVGLLYTYANGAFSTNSSIETSHGLIDQLQECPTWFFWNVTSHRCECSDSKRSANCLQLKNQTWLNRLYCMTYDNQTDSTAVGLCPYGELQVENMKGRHILLPGNRSKLNEAMCGKAHREGLLCSRCKSGYGPAVLSYFHACARCSNNHFGWLFYLSIALSPTTIFFLIIVLCQVHTTSAPLNFFVFACQMESVAIAESPQEIMYYSEVTKIILGILATFITPWNLEFFRFFIPPFCVNENLSNLQVLSMDYIVAFYPLVLTVVMYICIQQHARGCRLLVCLWKPFGYCFNPLIKRLNWNPTASFVPTFASFLLLSSTKILLVSFSLLKHGKLVTNMSDIGVINENKHFLYYDPNLTFMNHDHFPYAVLAIFVSLTFVILPCLVLMLYPTRMFQKFLNWSGVGCHAVHAFADAFNGCYKNGIIGTCDCRCFAAFYLLVRIVMLANYTTVGTKSPIPQLLSIAFVVIFALASPYKNRVFNVLDSFGLTLGLCRICLRQSHIIITIFGVYITFYFAALVSCTVILKLNYCCSQRLKALADRMSGAMDAEQVYAAAERPLQDVEDHLPDRVMNPDDYRLLTEGNDHEQPQRFNSNSVVPTYGSILDQSCA